MTKDETSGNRIVQALSQSAARSRAEQDLADQQRKEDARIRARAIIYDHISSWVGRAIAPGDEVPVIRDGEEVGPYRGLGMAGMLWVDHDPVDGLLQASGLQSESELQIKINRLKRAQDASDSFLGAFESLDLSEQARASVLGSEVSRASLQSSPYGRVIDALGASICALLSVEAIKRGLYCEINELRTEVARREDERAKEKGREKRGRKPNRARYEVALELAKIYARITGERPAYSENKDGLHGRFTPALRDVFDCFGWRSLAGPANAACRAITDDDLDYPSIPAMGSIFGVSKVSPE